MIMLQTASVMGLGAQKTKEAAPDGKGIHISAARPQNPSRSVFNKILCQGLAPKGMALRVQAADTEQGDKSGQETSGDSIPAEMSALLMQLNVMGAAVPTADAADGAATGTEEVLPVALTGGKTAFMTSKMPVGEPGDFILEPSGEEALTREGPMAEIPDGTTEMLGGMADESAGAARILREIAEAMTTAENAGTATAPPADGAAAPADTDGSINAAVQDPAVQTPVNTAAAASDDIPQRTDSTAPAEAAETAKAAQPQKPAGAAGARDSGVISETGSDLPDATVYLAQTAKTLSDGDYGGADGQQAGEDKPSVELSAAPGMTAALAGKPEAAADTEAAEKAAAVDKAFLRLTDDVRGLQAGRHEISIELEPESLGSLIISVVKTERGISATIRAEDKELCALMTDRLQQLISSMETKGIGVQDVEVLHTPGERGMDFSGQAFSQQREQASGGRGAPRDHRQSRPSEPAPTLVASAGDSEDATVEYHV